MGPAEGLCVCPAVMETWTFDDFLAIREELGAIAGDHVGGGPSGFSNLPFELVRKPQVIIVKEGNPLAFRMLDPEIAGSVNVALAERKIPAIMSGRDFPTCPPHIVAFPVRNDYDFVVCKCLRPHAGDGLRKHLRPVMRRNDN